LMVGPDWWGIHHVVLCRGPMQRVEETMLARFVSHEPSLAAYDLFEGPTIESSRPLKGLEYAWYPATSYFARRREEDAPPDELWAVGDFADNTSTIHINSNLVPVKLLMHPLRPGTGAPVMDLDTFRAAVDQSAALSKKWSQWTALAAITARRTSLHPTDYCNMAKRSELMEDLRRRWRRRPICSSVAIQIWQRYFELSSGTGPGGTDLAVQQILRWMPVKCDKTAPSALLKALSTAGWVLQGHVNP